jgi:hypothetical protein
MFLSVYKQDEDVYRPWGKNYTEKLKITKINKSVLHKAGNERLRALVEILRLIPLSLMHK